MMMSHNLSIKSRGVDHEYLGVSQQYWVDLLSAFMSVYWYVHICTYLQQKKWPKNTCLSPAQPWGIKWTGMSNGDLPHDHLLGWPVYWNMDTEWWKMMKTWVKNMSWLPQLQYIEGSLEVKLPTNFGQYLPLLCRFLIFETSATDVWVASSSRDPKTSGIAGKVLNHIAGIGEKPPKYWPNIGDTSDSSLRLIWFFYS